MPEFLHGVEIVEVDDGPRPVRTVRSAVIGLVGTAEQGPVNTPTLVAGSRAEGARLFGASGGTIPDALEAIFDQVGALVVVVNSNAPREVERQIALVGGALTIPDANVSGLVVQNVPALPADLVTYRPSLPGRQGDYDYAAGARRLTAVDRPQQAVDEAEYDGDEGVWTLPTQRVDSVVVKDQTGNVTYRATLPDGASVVDGDDARLGDYTVDGAAGTVTRQNRGAAAAVSSREYRAPGGATGAINLAHQRVSNVVVSNADGVAYTFPRDYTIEADAGVITRKGVSTSWPVGGTVHVTYDRADGPGDAATLKISYRRRAGMGQTDTVALQYRAVSSASGTTEAEVVGEVDVDGSYSGCHALLAAESVLGQRPRILCAPGWSSRLAVGNALIAVADRLRGVAVVEGPSETDSEATAYAARLTASRRAYFVDPQVRIADGAGGAKDAPASARVAGVIARTDHERGFWWSPSNRPVAGVLGTARPIDFELGNPSSRANVLNEAKVATVIREDGYRLWGNRTLSADPKYAFLSVSRTADLIQDSIQRAHRWAVDRNITRTYLEAVSEAVEDYLASLVSDGAIAGGSCVPSDTNTAAKIGDGQACFDVEFSTYSPAERVTFRVALTDDHLEEVL